MIPRQETTTTQKWVELQTYESVDLTSPTPLPAARGSGQSESPVAPYSSAHDHLSVGVASTDSGSRNGDNVAADELPLLPRSFASSDTIEEGHRPAKGSNDEDESPHEVATANMGSAVFNLATTIIGAGIMALPATMRVLGMPIGLLVICTMGVVSELSIEMLVHFLAIAKVWTFGDLVGDACGWAARAVAQICIVLNNAGILIVYLIIIGDVLAGSKNHVGLFEEWTGVAGWWSDRKLIVLITMVVVLAPLSSLRRIDSLHFSSAASVALALVFVFLSSVIALVKLAMGRLAMPRMLPSFTSKHAILELLTVIPIMSNAFVCHFNVPPIYLELKNRSPSKMFKVGRITAVLCVLVYSATALSGYLLFGDLTNSDVLVNFDADLGIPFSGALDDGIRIGYVLHLMLVFPVIHFSLRQTIDAVLFPQRPPLPESRYRFGIITFVLLVLIFVGSTVVPNIWVAFQFTGATTGLSLGFIFPALVVIRSKYKRGDHAHESLPLAWTILVMAVVISFLGIGTQIYNITTGQGS